VEIRSTTSRAVRVHLVTIGLLLGLARSASPTTSEPCLFVTIADPALGGQLEVVVIDTGDGQRWRFPVARLLSAIVPSASGKLLYGAFTTLSQMQCPIASRVGVITADTGESLRDIPLAVPGGAVAIVISPDGQHLYVGDNVASKLFVVNTATETVEDAIPLENAGGSCPGGFDDLPPQAMGLAVSMDGRWVAATTLFCGFDCIGTVSVLDTATNEIVQTIPLAAMHAAFSADSTKLFVTLRFSDHIRVIANPSGEIVDQISVRAINLSAQADEVYAPSGRGIAVISSVTNQVLRTIDVVAGEMVLERERPRGYTRTHSGVLAVDLTSGSVVDEFEISDSIGLSIGACPTTPGCFGDCDHSGSVTVDEIGILINVALGQPSQIPCSSVTAEGGITVVDVVVAVNNALRGCRAA